MTSDSRSPLRFAAILSFTIRALVPISAFIFFWSIIDYRSYRSVIGGTSFGQIINIWDLASIGILPLVLAARLWVGPKKGVGLDVVLVTFWVLTMLIFFGIAFSRPYVPVWAQ